MASSGLQRRPRPYARPVARPMTKWWHRNDFFRRYMWRELTALIVAIEAVVLLAGLACLASSDAAWAGFVGFLRSPVSIGLHLVLLAGMVYHAISWFAVMPKTMPAVWVGGKRVPDATISRAGWAAVVVVTIVVAALFLVWTGGAR